MIRRARIFIFAAFVVSCSNGEVDSSPAVTMISYPGPGPAGATEEVPFVDVKQQPESTFAADVDTASYSIMRSHVNSGRLPPKTEVRTEEFLNYFSYNYASPGSLAPIGAQFEVNQAPWNLSHRLLKIGIKAKALDPAEIPPLNLVFLIDVSGSMMGESRLPLLKSSLKLLTAQLRPQDQIGIVTYNDQIRVPLPVVTGDKKTQILDVIESLFASGSTNGGAGIQTAYDLARRNFLSLGINRVILSTDGDFNVGLTDTEALKTYVQAQAREGVSLTIHGYGMGNFKDERLETLADSGDGNYAFIDYLGEADKVFRMQLLGTIAVVARDVKVQVHFNPEVVSSYRLIGYENRLMPGEDFTNNEKDAGDIGSGHTVTVFYEIIPAKSNGKVLDMKIRFKNPGESQSQLMESPVHDDGRILERASQDFRFSAAAAAFALRLGESRYIEGFSFDQIIDLAEGALGEDPDGMRNEFVNLVKKANLFNALL